GQLDVRVGEPGGACESVLNLLRLLREGGEVLAVEADGEVVTRTRQHVANPVVREGLGALRKAGIARDDPLHRSERRAVVRVRADGDPHLAGIDVYDLVGGDGAADMSADLLDALDRAQFGTCPGRDPV